MLSVSEEVKSTTHKQTFITQYKIRPKEYDATSLHEYYHIVKNANRMFNCKKILIPNFVGVSELQSILSPMHTLGTH